MPEYQQNFLDEKKLSTIFLTLPTYQACKRNKPLA
jgi:hypothetical protein